MVGCFIMLLVWIYVEKVDNKKFEAFFINKIDVEKV